MRLRWKVIFGAVVLLAAAGNGMFVSIERQGEVRDLTFEAPSLVWDMDEYGVETALFLMLKSDEFICCLLKAVLFQKIRWSDCRYV